MVGEGFLRSQFLRHNAVFFVGSLLVGALNYLYYPVLGRLVSPETFGEVQTLVSLFLQLNIFLVVLAMIVVTVVTNYADAAQRNQVIFEFEKLALGIGLVIVLATLLLRTPLQHALQFASPWPFVVLGLAVMASVPFNIRGAYLRGKQRFALVAAGNMLAAAGKLVLSVVLVLLGLKTMGAIGGVLAAQIVACGLVAWWAHNHGLRQGTTAKRWLPNLSLLAPELRYGAVVLIASLAITLQYSLDIVLIKHYFDATTAGLYAGIAAVARIMFFLTASIAQVLLSKVTLSAERRANKNLLYKSLVLLVGTSLPLLLALMLAPQHVLQLLMGSSYQALAGLLPRLSLSVFVVSIINLITTYYLALRRVTVAVPVVCGAGLTLIFMVLHHGSPAALVTSLLAGSLVTVALLGVWRLTERREAV